MSKGATISLDSGESYSDYFKDDKIPARRDPVDGKYTPVTRFSDPGRYSPRHPYCNKKGTVSAKKIRQKLRKAVRITPTHRNYLMREAQFEILTRLEEQIRFVQVLIPHIFPLPVLHDLLGSGLIINIADFSYRFAENAQHVQSTWGFYSYHFNVISLNLPFPYPRLLTMTTILNELANAALAQIRARITHNPSKLPRESFKTMHDKLNRAAKMGMARLETIENLIREQPSIPELSNSSQRFLHQYHHLLLTKYQLRHHAVKLSTRQSITKSQQTGELQITGQTWHFKLHRSNLLGLPEGNFTFPEVIYDAQQPPNSESQMILFAHMRGSELVNFKNDELSRRSHIFPYELREALTFRHGDILSIPEGQLNLQDSLILHEEFFSGAQEFLGMTRFVFPEYCRFMSEMYCLPNKTFCATDKNLSEILSLKVDEPDDIKDSQKNSASSTRPLIFSIGSTLSWILSGIKTSANMVWLLGAMITHPRPVPTQASLVNPMTLFGANNSSDPLLQLGFNFTSPKM